jgi:hypothetical protein
VRHEPCATTPRIVVGALDEVQRVQRYVVPETQRNRNARDRQLMLGLLRRPRVVTLLIHVAVQSVPTTDFEGLSKRQSLIHSGVVSWFGNPGFGRQDDAGFLLAVVAPATFEARTYLRFTSHADAPTRLPVRLGERRRKAVRRRSNEIFEPASQVRFSNSEPSFVTFNLGRPESASCSARRSRDTQCVQPALPLAGLPIVQGLKPLVACCVVCPGD